MSDDFVPIAPARSPSGGNGFVPLQFKNVTASKTPGASNGASTPPRPPNGCGAPKVTLQRQGEIVTAIRIQCECGQVIELDCAY